MQVNEQWLREWVNPPVDAKKMGNQLTMAGLEVDAMQAVAGEFSQVVVGEVIELTPHPDAQKLRVTRVNIGASVLQIVCGAANVAVGLRVPVALVGAQLPGGLTIKEAKLRGVESFGMLCSAAELGIVEQADGLLELPADAPIGQSIRDYLKLDDWLFELGITPNRGDCLSVRGLARELAVINRVDICQPQVSAATISSSQTQQVTVANEAAQACPRYVGRVIEGVNASIPSPLWLQEKLRRVGIRSINPIVDITNLVMLELGQPMHAFDAAKLTGTIQVRFAKAEENITLLDGQTLKLRSDTLVIADEKEALALAGIMGGQATSVDTHTQRIFLESAFFEPLAIVGKARSYGLHTDSSHRFERGVDYELPLLALERATQLIIALVGGQAGAITTVEHIEHLPKRETVTLRAERITQLLGIQLAADQVQDILTRLGMQVTVNPQGWSVLPPSWRFDIAIEVDLIEELARIYGYNNFPKSTAQAALRLAPLSETKLPDAALKRFFVAKGYQEAITMSFVEPGFLANFDKTQPLALANPISNDLSVMRTTLWAGLVKALQYNQNRQQARVRLFEVGLRFIPTSDGLQQEKVLAGLACGTVLPELWNNSKKELDFFDIKGNIEQLFAQMGISGRVSYQAAEHGALHPGQTAQILFEQKVIGWVGRIHPQLHQQLGLLGPVFLFEIALEDLPEANLSVASELSRFPEVRRDIAVVAPQTIAVAPLLATVKSAAGQYLRDSWLFDVYAGQGVAEGMRSLAIAMVWQHPERTLQDEETQQAVESVLAILKEQYNVSLRD